MKNYRAPPEYGQYRPSRAKPERCRGAWPSSQECGYFMHGLSSGKCKGPASAQPCAGRNKRTFCVRSQTMGAPFRLALRSAHPLFFRRISNSNTPFHLSHKHSRARWVMEEDSILPARNHRANGLHEAAQFVISLPTSSCSRKNSSVYLNSKFLSRKRSCFHRNSSSDFTI